jgi:ABC-type dipeptide/oligopeptide/nickel transport system ATPase subunit
LAKPGPDPRQLLRDREGGISTRVGWIGAADAPRILIADEPTAGLDVSVQGDLLNLLQELLADNDLTLVVVSHNWPSCG